MSLINSSTSLFLVVITSSWFWISLVVFFILVWLVFNSFISVVMVSLTSSMIFSSAASILMLVFLNYKSGILLISVSIRTLGVTFSYCFFWDKFLYNDILPRSLSPSLSYKILLRFLLLGIMTLWRRGHIMSRDWHSRTCLWCVLHALCFVFWVHYPSGKSSEEFLLNYSGECLDLDQSVMSFNLGVLLYAC